MGGKARNVSIIPRGPYTTIREPWDSEPSVERMLATQEEVRRGGVVMQAGDDWPSKNEESLMA